MFILYVVHIVWVTLTLIDIWGIKSEIFGVADFENVVKFNIGYVLRVVPIRNVPKFAFFLTLDTFGTASCIKPDSDYPHLKAIRNTFRPHASIIEPNRFKTIIKALENSKNPGFSKIRADPYFDSLQMGPGDR